MNRETSIALWLAKVMGKPGARIHENGHVCFLAPAEPGSRWEVDTGFNPQHDRAQWAECVEWAWKNRIALVIDSGNRMISFFDGASMQWRDIGVETYPETKLIETYLESLALATGWPGMEG